MANDIGEMLRLVASGNTEELERLLEQLLKDKGENFVKELINSKGYSDRTLMHQAAGLGKVEIMKCLEKYGADIYARDDGDLFPMDGAVANNQIESIKCLKELKVDLEKENSEGRTAIFGAAALGKIESIICLKALGANVNAKDNNGCTPIFIAIMANQIASIKWLRALGADLKETERSGCTPMFLAVFSGDIEIMECLRGSDLYVKNSNKMTLRDVARAAGHSEDSEVMKWLLDAEKKESGTFTDSRSSKMEKGTFTDPRDGKTYKTVTIGNQVWMAENLNYEASGSKCYDNNPANDQKYGRLYDWETAKRACPPGWHLPSDAEWTTLTDFVGGSSTAGTKLKSANGWNSNGNGTDEYGFSALTGGYGRSNGSFNGVGKLGWWWSATEDNASNAYSRDMYVGLANVGRSSSGKASFFSVRCVKD
jgi:uncharacterized protein (TIGR02145 family)